MTHAGRPTPVSYRDVSTISMVAGKEKTISRVIHDGEVKEWVGIGWISKGKATEADYQTTPEVKDAGA